MLKNRPAWPLKSEGKFIQPKGQVDDLWVEDALSEREKESWRAAFYWLFFLIAIETFLIFKLYYHYPWFEDSFKPCDDFIASWFMFMFTTVMLGLTILFIVHPIRDDGTH